jgi:hypothetical protein
MLMTPCPPPPHSSPRAATPPASAAWRVFAVTRLVVIAVAWIGLVVRPLAAEPGKWRAFPSLPALDGWARWDAGWFFSVIDRGYYVSDGQSNVPFFPLYPLVSYVVGAPFRVAFDGYRSFFLGGLVVSHVAFAFALVGLERLGRRSVGAAATRRALWLLVLFPFAFYFAAVYSESLFLALSVWSLVFARDGRWRAAAVTCAACVLVRITGLAVLIALAGAYVIDARRHQRRLVRADAFFLLLPVAALAAFELYFVWKFGDARVYTHVQDRGWSKVFGLSQWLRAFAWMWSPGDLGGKVRIGSYLVMLPLIIALLVLGRRRLSPAELLFASVSVALIVLTGHRGEPGLDSVGRYVSVIFPLFFVAGAELATPAAFATGCVIGGTFQLVFLYMFSHWMQMT